MLKAYQIYYLENQKEHLLPGFSYFFNKDSTIFLESEVAIDLFNKCSHEEFEWFGIFSWKVGSKLTSTFSYDILSRAASALHRADIIAPKLTSYPWGDLNESHNPRYCHSRTPGMWEAVDLILQKLGIPDLGNGNHLNKTIYPIYTNSFIFKKTIANDFYNNFLAKVIDLIKNDKQISSLAYLESDYNMQFELPPSLAEKTGLKKWPHIPFILERMINVYYLTHKKKVAFVL